MKNRNLVQRLLGLSCSLLLVLVLCQSTRGDIVAVMFTGFNPDSPSGMDFLQADLQSRFQNDFPNQSFSSSVFAYNRRGDALNFINSHSDIDHLFLIGHSWGGNALVRLATNSLLPANILVDRTFQIDTVDIFDPFDPGIGGTVLPANVELGWNFFQIPTGFLEPGGEQNVQGAININAEVFFSDDSITHTSIDNDVRLYDFIYQEMRSVVIPEPVGLSLVAIGLALATGMRRTRCTRITG